jgi:malonyl-CoA/methylmalonyl-CoA synthetase
VIAGGWARHGVDPVDLTAEGSLPSVFSRRWRDEPNRVVLVDGDGRDITAGELDARSQAVARRLAAARVRKDDRVLLSGSASADYVAAYCGALRAGFVVVPVNGAYTRRELGVIVEDSKPRAAILESAEMRSWIDAKRVVVTGMDVDIPDGPAVALDEVGPFDPALLPYTSGTTGRPKGALLSHGNLLAGAEAVRLAWRWTEHDRLWLALVLFHMHGLGVGINGTLAAGSAAILRPRFDVEELCERANEATMYFGVPTNYARIVTSPNAKRLSSLRLCVSGSAPLSADMHREIEQRCGQVVLERYGMTETVMLVSNPYDGERRAGTVGFPLPGVDLHLDEDDEICVRGPNVFSGYWGNPEATDASFTGDGYFRTGDVGAIDDNGYVSIVGRAKELIISGGYNVYPREIEDVLREHPSVTDAAVVGTPSDEWGEVVTAYVVASDELDEGALIAFAAERLAPYKKPRIVHRIDEIPRNTMGKILRDELNR